MSRAVKTAFILYSCVAVFAAYEARVIASRAERKAPSIPAPVPDSTVADLSGAIETALAESSRLVAIDSTSGWGRDGADSTRASAPRVRSAARSADEAEVPRTGDPAAGGGK